MAGVPTVGSKTGTATASADVFGGMGPDMFLKLLVAQLQYQNPMSPSDPTAMLSQVSHYAQVEALNKLQTLQANGNALTEAQTATDAIGQQVTAMTAPAPSSRAWSPQLGSPTPDRSWCSTPAPK